MLEDVSEEFTIDNARSGLDMFAMRYLFFVRVIRCDELWIFRANHKHSLEVSNRVIIVQRARETVVLHGFS